MAADAQHLDDLLLGAVDLLGGGGDGVEKQLPAFREPDRGVLRNREVLVDGRVGNGGHLVEVVAQHAALGLELTDHRERDAVDVHALSDAARVGEQSLARVLPKNHDGGVSPQLLLDSV